MDVLEDDGYGEFLFRDGTDTTTGEPILVKMTVDLFRVNSEVEALALLHQGNKTAFGDALVALIREQGGPAKVSHRLAFRFLEQINALMGTALKKGEPEVPPSGSGDSPITTDSTAPNSPPTS